LAFAQDKPADVSQFTTSVKSSQETERVLYIHFKGGI